MLGILVLPGGLLGGYWVATGWAAGRLLGGLLGLLVRLLGGYWGYWAPEHAGLLVLLGLPFE